MTFIDHRRGIILNGSRLGKQFSAGKFNDLYNGNGNVNQEGRNMIPDMHAYADAVKDLLLNGWNEGPNPDYYDYENREQRKKKKKKRQRKLR